MQWRIEERGFGVFKPPLRNSEVLTNLSRNSLKVPKIKKTLLYEMKFLVPNYSCLQNPWLGGYRPQIPVLSVFCPQLSLLNPPPPTEQNSWIRHWFDVSAECSLAARIPAGRLPFLNCLSWRNNVTGTLCDSLTYLLTYLLHAVESLRS
jgi:hypothetical protein